MTKTGIKVEFATPEKKDVTKIKIDTKNLIRNFDDVVDLSAEIFGGYKNIGFHRDNGRVIIVRKNEHSKRNCI